MTSTTMPVTDYTVPITLGLNTASFVFRVSRQPAATRTIASFGQYYDKYTLTFIARDVTDYEASGNPRAKFGVALTEALLRALRVLCDTTGSIIPKPGSAVSFGAPNSSYVESIDIAQMTDKSVDAFLITCNLKEPASAGGSGLTDDDRPKLAKSDEIAPWDQPAEVSFDASTGEGMTLGFALPTTDLDGTKSYTQDSLRKLGAASSTSAIAVENYAGDPFASPPSLPKVNGTLRVSKGFLRADAKFDPSVLRGLVNRNDITISINGVRIFFAANTLSITSLNVNPRIYKKEVPWYPLTKHPLNKTYGELFYGYSRTVANKIAVNRTNNILVVQKPLRYLEIAGSFTYRMEGFGVWLANRGYAQKDGAKLSPVVENGMVKEAWLDKTGKKTDSERIWRGYTTVQASDEVKTVLEAFFPTVTPAEIPWAGTSDGYGGTL